MKTAAASLPDKRKPTLSFEFLPIGRIRPNPNSAREHGRKQIEKLKRSIERFGFVTPLVIDDTNQLLGDHGRLEAAEQLGYEVVPVVRASQLRPPPERRV
jgi:ParB-like chromosome segregation protein Spo0J